MDRRTKARRRFHTDRVVAARRARYLREMGSWIERDMDWLGKRLSYGRLADRDPWDCGSRCLMCHGEKLLGARRRRAREKRVWRSDWNL